MLSEPNRELESGQRYSEFTSQPSFSPICRVSAQNENGNKKSAVLVVRGRRTGQRKIKKEN